MAPPVEVYDKSRRPVRAKMLVDAAGRYVRDPMTGAPLIVDEDFDMDRAIAFGRSLQTIPALNDNPDVAQRAAIYMSLIKAFVPSGPLDMQRSYNGMVGGGGDEFVRAFRPAASYLLGVVGRAAGLTPQEIMLGAGIQRLGAKQSYPYLDTSGPMFNDPQNARWIEEGMKGHDSRRFFKSAPGQQGGTDQTQEGEQAPAEDPIMGGQPLPPLPQPQPPMPIFADLIPQSSDPQLKTAGQSPAYQQVAATAGPGLPQHVIDAGNLLRANGYEITPRTMYLAHVLGPQAAVDLIKRTGSTYSPAVPSPDAATGDQMREWVRALRLGPAAQAGAIGGLASAPDAGAAMPSQPDDSALVASRPFA